jgi:hypothetical protein
MSTNMLKYFLLYLKLFLNCKHFPVWVGYHFVILVRVSFTPSTSFGVNSVLIRTGSSPHILDGEEPLIPIQGFITLTWRKPSTNKKSLTCLWTSSSSFTMLSRNPGWDLLGMWLGASQQPPVTNLGIGPTITVDKLPNQIILQQLRCTFFFSEPFLNYFNVL